MDSIYILTEDDVFENICVQVTAANCSGSIISPLFGPIKKAEQPAPDAPQLENCTESSITLVTLEDGEYNMNDGEWQVSPVFEGLEPETAYTFTQRKKETRSHNASPASPEAVFSTRPDQIEEIQRNAFKVYPNPAKDHIIVEGSGVVTLTNALGQTILTKEIHGKEKMELPQGLYFVKMGSETRKIVVE